MEGLTALVLGATGEVGKKVVHELISHPSFTKVTLIVRRQLQIESPKVDQKVVDFDSLDAFRNAFSDSQVAYCCLGTTRGKAGAEGFVKVDKDYVYQCAQILKEYGCRHFHLVSSVGADKNSHFLYPKTKGEVEELVGNLEFDRVSIYRPSLLICDREESRPLEWVAQVLAKGFDWRNKASIATEVVARAMVTNTLVKPEGEPQKVEILSNTDIHRLGAGAGKTKKSRSTC